MNSHLIKCIAASAVMFPCIANALPELDNRSKVEALIVSGYAIANTNIDKIIFFNNIYQGCSAKKLGYYSFVDIEGGNINRIKNQPLASANDSLFLSETQYKDQLNSTLGSAKNDYCVDVALAPMMDVGYSNRSYFLEEYQIEDIVGVPDFYYKDGEFIGEKKEREKELLEEKVNRELERLHTVGFERVVNYMDVANEKGLTISLKHYPLTYYPDNELIDTAESDAQREKWTEKKLIESYSEIIVRSTSHESPFVESSISKHYNSLLNRLTKDDMIMLSSYQFDFTDYQPYVASESPQNDEFLQSFEGLVITDDLYQLNLKDNDLENIFLNSDLFIITSLNDVNVFTEKVTDLVNSNPRLEEALNKKYKKVKIKFPTLSKDDNK